MQSLLISISDDNVNDDYGNYNVENKNDKQRNDNDIHQPHMMMMIVTLKNTRSSKASTALYVTGVVTARIIRRTESASISGKI